MARFPPEQDWETLRALHPTALGRYCERVLLEVTATLGDTARSPHERYLAVYDLMKRRDREMADAFDDMRRSRALDRILAIRRLRLFTEEEYARFTDAMRDEIAKIER